MIYQNLRSIVGRRRRLDALRRHGRDARPGDREPGRALCRRRARDRRRVRRGRAPDRHDDARTEGPHARRAAALRDGGLALTVPDTGIGIAPENIAKAFESFRRIDSRLSRRYEGAGLGLPLTKQLVELHGGSIALDSRAGQGTTATVTFPAARVVPAETRIAA